MIQIQDEEIKRDYWRKAIDAIIEDYKLVMNLFKINLCLNIYKI